MKDFDVIKIENLEIFANHGVYPEETALGQKFLVSMELYTDTRKAGKTDALEASIDYGSVCRKVTEFMKENTYKLIEACAESIAEMLLAEYGLLSGVTVEVKKPWAPIGLPVDCASVRITRFWHRAYMAIGSNLGDKKGYLDGAVKHFQENPSCRNLICSKYLATEPYGVTDQDEFLNACFTVETLMSPGELLDLAHDAEAAAGRVRTMRWGPRTLDVDIIFYDDEIISEENLTVPHPDMENRDFVLMPLAEIAPGKVHPVLGKTVKQLAEELGEISY